MNILGQPFSPWVTKQINVRQTSLGNSTNLTNNNLLYQNAKSPWLRLASTVDITLDGENHKKLIANTSIDGSILSGDTPARNFILQGGASKLVGSKTEEGDINYSFKGLNAGLKGPNNSSSNNGDIVVPQYSGAYGWGGLEDRGFAPMPGLIGAKVEYYKSGALSKATVNMKCYTRNQLALMDVLYMRPGYNLLLEFGWSQYLDNDGTLQTYDNFLSPALSFIFDPISQLQPPSSDSNGFSQHTNLSPINQSSGLSTSVSTLNFLPPNQTIQLLEPGEVVEETHSDSYSHFDVLNLIQKERIERAGNYEGVFGKINNFKWTFNPDGSYDCSVDLIGMGDMMESLKINTITYSIKDVEQVTDEDKEENPDPPVVANRDKSTLNGILWRYYEGFNTFPPPEKTQSGFIRFAGQYQDIKIPNFPNVKTSIGNNGEMKTIYSANNILTIPNGLLGVHIKGTDLVGKNPSPQVYITFGSLLAVIQKHLLIYNENGCPLFSFDVDFRDLGNDKNYMICMPGQFSANPMSCLIPYYGADADVNLNVGMPLTALNTFLQETGRQYYKNEHLSRLCNVYLNINNVVDILDNTKRDEDGSLSLLTFVNAIIEDFTKSIGGINKITVKIDEATQHIRFIENSPQSLTLTDDVEDDNKEFAKFNTFGVTVGDGGSFVRSINMEGGISSKFSSAIVIGAQANGNKPSSNSTGLSTYNEGLIDRVIPEKNNANHPKDSSPSNPNDLNPFTMERREQSKSIESVWKKISPKIKQNEVYKTDSPSLFNNIYNVRNWNSEEINALTELNINYMSLVSGYYVSIKKTKYAAFLPFTLSLDIDGMSGMRLYERFNADDRILPPSYGKDNVDLVITTLNHNITSGDWTTQIATKTTPRQKVETETTLPILGSEPNPPVSTNEQEKDKYGIMRDIITDPPPKAIDENDEVLRLRLTRIMDDGDQTLGVLECLSTDGQTVLFSLATSELPWKGNENDISCIPTGRYRVKSHVSQNLGISFWLGGRGSEAKNYKFGNIVGNGYTRFGILIHMFPKAKDWAKGCIGPGMRFNDRSNQIGRQQGTGQHYLHPSAEQSYQALDLLVAKLYPLGSFQMEIVNQGGVQSSSLPSSFNTEVQAIATVHNLLPTPYTK